MDICDVYRFAVIPYWNLLALWLIGWFRILHNCFFFRCQTKTNNIVTVIKFVIDWNGLLLDGGDSLQCVIFFYFKRHNSQHAETKYLIAASDRQSNSLSHLFSIVYVLANIILHNSKGNPRMLEWKMSSLIAKVIDWKWLNWIKYTRTFAVRW